MSAKVFDKVAWSEGTLLVPQHFQQLDRYHESLLAYRLDALTPVNWGVLQADWDLRALQQGVASLTAFQGVMPDGTALTLGGELGGALPKQRPIGPHFPPSQRALRIQLAIPSERPTVNNYAREEDGLRYAIATRRIHDTARDDRAAEVSIAAPNVSLLLGNESANGFTTMPIGELVRDERGELTLSSSFIPPCLRMSSSQVFVQRQANLLRTMIGRLGALSETRRLTGEGRVEFNAADVTRYLQISALSRSLPLMHHLARAKDIAPRYAYTVLCQLAGELAVFSPEADMTVPYDFDYNDLTGTFSRLFDLCDTLLSSSDTERFVSCVLQPHGQNRRYGDLRDVRLEHCVRFLLSVESTLPRPQVVEEIVRRAKVASHADMDLVLNKNIGGIAVAESLRPPTELPIKPGLVYFDLPNPQNDAYWRHVMQDRNIVVWLPPLLDQAQTQVKLLGIFGSRQ
ncbi:MAG TPA: type VI secretion system baseplate subunit TssK [Polyangiales bacterium]